MATRTLRDVLVSVRSKNAGPFTVTFDLFFPDAETFWRMVNSKVVTRETVADAYGLRPDQVGCSTSNRRWRSR